MPGQAEAAVASFPANLSLKDIPNLHCIWASFHRSMLEQNAHVTGRGMLRPWRSSEVLSNHKLTPSSQQEQRQTMPGKLSRQQIAASQRRRDLKRKETEDREVVQSPLPQTGPPTEQTSFRVRLARLEARRKALENNISFLNVRAKAEHSYAAQRPNSALLQFHPIPLPVYAERATTRNITRLETELKMREDYMARERLGIRLCEEMEIANETDGPIKTMERIIEAHERYLSRMAEAGLKLRPDQKTAERMAELRAAYEAELSKGATE
ncbi:hypothetical protein BJ508DRAFT_313550 [Ascobolus immersus RN42]|uniref:Uncharacterized protein n=1 Tax=Ascobolus immersus RN42 TaxID=1160509 RepID=A0A3N4HNN0_ASCIM|nr:hypothetical protein BJ508DRAFT_313550 [Ascobolus immersus RN42]